MRRLLPQDRPREKLARAGAAALGENELVALLVGSGVRARDALGVAEDVLAAAGGVHGLARVGLDELTRVAGVGPSRAARLVAAVELGRRVVAGGRGSRPVLSTPAAVAAHLLPLYGGHRVERFGLVLLDTKYRLIRTAILSVGSLDASIADPREIFREAALASAAAIVVFHNHPSGDPRPSAEDVGLTARLRRAGDVMGIEVVDHIILGDGRWFSFKDAMRL
ncbi:MAG: DNA repair protein RadC [Vicinamibacterales bacterium]